MRSPLHNKWRGFKLWRANFNIAPKTDLQFTVELVPACKIPVTNSAF